MVKNYNHVGTSNFVGGAIRGSRINSPRQWRAESAGRREADSNSAGLSDSFRIIDCPGRDDTVCHRSRKRVIF